MKLIMLKNYFELVAQDAIQEEGGKFFLFFRFEFTDETKDKLVFDAMKNLLRKSG